jgi:hypothetical protein
MSRTPRSPTTKPKQPRRERRQPIDGVTTAERERPHSDDPALLAEE